MLNRFVVIFMRRRRTFGTARDGKRHQHRYFWLGVPGAFITAGYPNSNNRADEQYRFEISNILTLPTIVNFSLL